MKKTFYKLISLIVASCIILSIVPVFLMVSADEITIPNKPSIADRSDIIIAQDGVESTFGSKYGNLPTNTKITLSPAINLSDADLFEFDVYVESVQNLKNAIENYSGEKSQKLLFAFSSASISALFASQQVATVDITQYITQDGWNHISVSKKDFIGTNIKWNNVKYAFLKFDDNSSTLYSTNSKLTDDLVALTNICTTIPARSGDSVLFSEVYANTLGESADSSVLNVANRFEIKNLEKANLDGNYYVLVDFKVSDFESFSEFINGRKLKFKLYSGEETSIAEVDSNNIFSNGKNWKKLKICVEDFVISSGFDFKNVDGFSIGINSKIENEKLNEFYSLKLFVGGVYSSVDSPAKPEIKNKYTLLCKYYDAMNSGILTEKFDFKLNYSNNIPIDLTGSGIASYTYSQMKNNQKNDYFDCIEFDLYVEDAKLFASSLASKSNTLKLSFYSNGKTDDASGVVLTFSAEEIAELVTNDGWNHFVIDAYDKLDSISSSCNFDFAKVTGWQLSFGGTLTNSNASSGYPIQVANITTTIKKILQPQINNKYKSVSKYYTGMSYGLLGKDFNFTLSYSNNANPFDLTASGLDSYTYNTANNTDKKNKYFDYFEFDIYVENVNKFKNACSAKGNTISLRLNSKGSIGDKDCIYIELSLNEISRFLVQDGWNHVVVEANIGTKKGSSTGDFDFAKVTGWTLFFNGILTNENSAEGQLVEIANICTTVNKLEKPVINNKHKLITEYYTDMITKTCEYNFSWQKIIDHKANPIDWTASGIDSYKITTVIQKDFVNRYFDTLEFDFYVADVDDFCKALSAKNNQVRLRFYTNAVSIGENSLLEIIFTGDDFAALLTKDGWNHLTIETDKFTYNGAPDFTKVTSWLIDFVGNLANYNSAVGQKIAIANICITDDESKPNTLQAPELPQNVITRIEKDSAHALGSYFGYTSDRIYAEGIGPYDFSKGNTIEFDVYVSDYETLKKSFEECPRGENLYIVFSSVPLNLFDQYSKPRTYYSSQCSISDKITQTGWNHIKLGKADFQQLAGTLNWSNITSFMLRYSDCKFNVTDKEEFNPAGDVRVKITNIVNTGIVSKVPYDEKQLAKPDKNAVYINESENLFDENGSWNPSGVYLDENYKTENEHSILRKISYDLDTSLARMFYLFDKSADLGDIKTLKLDFFVDIPQFIKKSGNVIEVGLSSKRNLEGSYTWKIDTASLKEGWNSLSLDIADAEKNGKVSLDEIKTVFIRFAEINLSSEDYETVVIGVDNLRYLSNNSNKTLKINGVEDVVVEDSVYEDTFDEEFTTIDTEISTNNDVKPRAKSKTIYLKQTVNKVVTNYVLAIIILCAEFVVYAVASTLVVIITVARKKKK